MESKTVLVVEDERPLSDAVKAKLELSNFTVLTSRTVEQAMDYVQTVPGIDAIWLDHYLLGKENGLDFVTKLKGSTEFNTIPVFVVSNTASPDKVQSYMRLRVNKYYVKAEHRLDEIIAEIQRYLDNPED